MVHIRWGHRRTWSRVPVWWFVYLVEIVNCSAWFVAPAMQTVSPRPKELRSIFLVIQNDVDPPEGLWKVPQYSLYAYRILCLRLIWPERHNNVGCSSVIKCPVHMPRSRRSLVPAARESTVRLFLGAMPTESDWRLRGLSNYLDLGPNKYAK